jgi:amino acid adenylation domain-containing protein
MSTSAVNQSSTSLWRNPNFRLFLISETLSSIGDSFSYVAIPLLVLRATGSIAQMGLVTGATGVASIGTGVVAGVVADRVNRQALLMACDIARCLLYAAIPIAWLFSPQLWLVYLVVPLAAVFGMLFQVTYVTVVPNLVEPDQITEANGRLYGSYAVAAVGGPTAAGLISGYFNPSIAIAVDSLSFAVSAVGLLLLRRRLNLAEQGPGAQPASAAQDTAGKKPAKRATVREEFLVGARFLWAHEILRPLTIRLSLLTFLTYGLTDVIIFHVRHDLGRSDTSVGYVLSAGTVGTLIASSLVARLRRRFGFGASWTVAYTLCGVVVVGLGLARSIPLVAVLATVILSCTGVAGISSMSFRQEVTPSPLLGRVTAAFWTIHSALGPPGAAALTALAAGYGVTPVCVVAGIAISLIALSAISTQIWRSRIRYRADKNQAGPANEPNPEEQTVPEPSLAIGPEVGPLPGVSVLDVIEAAAEHGPDAPAVVDGRTRLTCGELDQAANRLAQQLLTRHGVEPEDRVGILMERSAAAVVAVLAVWKAGAAYVPVDLDSPELRRKQILADAGVRLVLTDAAPDPGPAGAPAESAAVDLRALTAPGPPAPRPARSIGPDSISYVIYTSGSTGRPKGVMATHGGLLGNHLAWESAFALRGRIKAHAQMANFAFDGFLGELVRGLCSEAALVICPRELLMQPQPLLELLRAEGVDVADFVPPVLRALAAYAEESGERLDSLKMIIVGSDAFPAAELASVKRLSGPDTKVVNCYGLTEGTIDSTRFLVSAEEDYGRSVMIGLPLPGTEAHILDEDLVPVAPGATGTLYIAGPTLTRGYLGDPAKTADAFIPHPHSTRPGARMYRTGDQARYRETGQGPQIEFLGRADRQVQLRGYRVELGEVEQALRRSPGVRDVAAVTDDGEPDRRRIHAYLVVDPGHDATDWHGLLRESIPAYMAPSRLFLLPALPVTANGKIDYAALPSSAATEITRANAGAAPAATATEHRVVALFQDALQHPELGADDDFFFGGGDSLLAMGVIAKVHEEWGAEISVRTFFRAPTAARLAVEIDRQSAEGATRPAETDRIVPAVRELVDYPEEA